MNFTHETVQLFRSNLQQSISTCSERGLFQSAKWASELLHGIHEDFLDDKELPIVEEYDSRFRLFTAVERNKYQYARSLFQTREFNMVVDVLSQTEHPRLDFLRLYAQYLVGERKREEGMQDVLDNADNANMDNPELSLIYQELYTKYKKNGLDAFGLYLYGVILKKQESSSNAIKVLLESIRAYQYNWSAWLELASLVKNKYDLKSLKKQLNEEFKTSIMKEFFFAKICVDLQYEGFVFQNIMDRLDNCFPHSAYVLSQWANFYYNTMDFNESLVLFEELRMVHPSRLEYMDVFSNVLYLLNKKDRLFSLAMECEKVDKYRPETCCVRGNYYVLMSRPTESIEYFKRAIKLDKSYYLAWNLLGHSYIELQETRASIECYRHAVDYKSWYGLGQAYEIMKQPSSAVFSYQKAADLRPQDGRMWRALAECYKSLKKIEFVENYYRRAESCVKKSARSDMLQIVNIFERKGKKSFAFDFYHRVWENAIRDDAIDDQISDIGIKLAREAKSAGHSKQAKQYALSILNSQHHYEAQEILDTLSQHLD